MKDNQSSADVVVVGTGVVGCLIAEQVLDAGHSVLMLEAGPRVQRWQIVENYRNLPPTMRGQPDAPYPPVPWAPIMETYTPEVAASYIQTEGPNAVAYQQEYVRYAGGATWHWSGLCWRLTDEDMHLKSRFGVGADWPFDYSVLEPYYTRAEYALGVAGPRKPELQWPPVRSKPYPMDPFPFGPGDQRLTAAFAKIGLLNIPAPQARNSAVSYQGRPPCCGNNNCTPVCPIAAKYDASTALPRIEAKGGRLITNAVVYRVETGAKNRGEAVHYLDPNKLSHRVTGKLFVIACNGIETPKILLMSKDERNPNGVANRSDQLGRHMMDQPKLIAKLEDLKEPLWTGVGPMQTSSVMQTSQGAFRNQHCGALLRFNNMARSQIDGIKALKKGLVGKALDAEIRRLSACTGEIDIEHEILPEPTNRLTLSSKKDWLGLNKPNVYYDVGNYVRRGSAEMMIPIARQVGAQLGAKVTMTTEYVSSTHIMGACRMGTDAATSVTDVDCRAHDHDNLFLPGGAAMVTAGSGNSTLSMSALALKAADAIVLQLKRG